MEKGSLDPVNKTSTQRSRRTATGRSNTRLSIGHSSITTNKGASTLHQDVEKSCTGGCELVTRREATFSEHALSEPWRGWSAGHQGRGGDARRGSTSRAREGKGRLNGACIGDAVFSRSCVSVPINKGTQPTNEHEEACLKVRVPGACDISPMQGRSFTGRGRCAGQILMDAGARCASTSCAWHQ